MTLTNIAAALEASETVAEAEDLMYRFAEGNPGWQVVDSDGEPVAEDSPDRESTTLYLLDSDSPWVADDGNAEVATTADTNLEAAQEYVSDGDWGDGKCSVRVHVWKYALDINGEQERVAEDSFDVDAGSDPEAPGECGTDDDDHDWETPLELVGGCRENPGVFSIGGTTFRATSVCASCGTYRISTSRGEQRNPGEAASEIEYREADEHSRAWIKAA